MNRDAGNNYRSRKRHPSRRKPVIAGARQSRNKRFQARDYQRGAQTRLKRFRQGSMLAVALTALLLMIWGGQTAPGQDSQSGTAAPVATETQTAITTDPGASFEQATGTMRDLLMAFYGLLPKLAIGLIILFAAVLVSKLFTCIVHRVFSRWEKSEAVAALGRIVIYLTAVAATLSIIAGDARALLGSIGLVGLALSWALQTPIESFTGWLLNSFRSYYRVGDRIEVGEVFGDVYKIDVLTTTVWEAGGPGKAVAGAQSTGAMITFPNWEVLRSNIVNYSRDFPYVWDEVTISIANESDIPYAIKVFEDVAKRLLGTEMQEPARRYERLLRKALLAFEVEEEPKVFVSSADAWINCTVRYLVDARTRRRWASAMIVALNKEASLPQHAGKIIPSYPRTEVKLRETWNPKEQP